MKKQLSLVFVGLLIFLSCQKPATNPTKNTEEVSAAPINGAPGLQRCATYEVLQQQLIENPSLKSRMDEIEKFTQQFMNNPQAYKLIAPDTYEIPVVFNVLYKTSAQNVSDAQLASQIDVLNEDFGATNSDYNNTPPLFQPIRSGNINVQFKLVTTVRKPTNKTQWSTNNAMKKSSQGGIDPTDPTHKLNIWVCNMGGGILGYAQFPGGNSATDGVVLDDEATGRTGTAKPPYGLGRTATHEVGHWLNLRHIWGDATCGNDQVGDTPLHNTANYGCPVYPHLSTCTGTPVEMTMNYMDYTYDACMYMFTAGQKTRMHATFGSGGGRTSFAGSL